MKDLDSYYKNENGIYLIEIRLSNVSQIFNSFDPSPFLEKDLDEDAEAYIFQSASEFSLKTPLKLVFYVPQQLQDAEIQILPEAIHNYFDYRKHNAGRELRQTLRQGRISLLIGLMFLGLCVTISKLITLFSDDTFANIVTEGLLIVGWVAMWRPLEIFLYDWWPIHRTQQVFDKLSSITIDIRAT
ncbi:hypothetical protein H6G41_00040 [Tolypothrix sp. FACHB-123]|uniref:hypothetical protein n=1 Tax=Tolypothrix sp. FACHB-123 TaxID=2692868 RepID=UPI001685ADD0|nr:hypothetical protein [Tolypothrix sp. FACHB-123]MBD2353023.1 hypothetical protein [Tolypothrix sp. FACHB-123]